MILLRPAPLMVLALLAGPVSAQTAPPGPAEDPRTLLLQARGLQRRGGGDDPKAAIALYRRVIELLPSSSEAHLRLSEALAESGDMESALAEARQAVELAPERPEASAHLALLLHRHLQANAAVQEETRKALEAASRLLPHEVEIWARLGEVSEQAKDSEGALKAWLKVGRLRPQISFAWEKAAFFAHNLNRYDAKREAIMALCAGKSPDNKHLRWLEDLARDQLKAGYLGHAEDSFRLLARHFSQEPSVWENMALVQLNTSRFEEALGSLREAEKLRSTPRLALNVAFCLMNLGDFQGAEARLRKLFMETAAGPEADKLRAEARVLLASTLLLQDRPAQLLELLQGWPETELQAELLGLRAQARIRSQDWKGARQDLRTGMAQFPTSALFRQSAEIPPGLFEEGFFSRKGPRQALQQLDLEATAGLWGEFRRWDRCLEGAEQALKASPLRTVNLMLLAANALDQLDRHGEAVKLLRQALKLDPKHPTVQNNLGYLLLEEGKELNEASALIEASVKQEPENGSVLDSWGWVLFKQGRLEESEKALRKAAEISPYSPEVRKHLGEVLLKLGRSQEAAEQWERALAFVFPERKALAKRLQSLQAQLAKRAPVAPAPDQDPPAPAPDEEDPRP